VEGYFYEFSWRISKEIEIEEMRRERRIKI